MPFDPIARFYDADDGRLSEDIAPLLDFAQKTGGPVLDLGVGTGRLALPLAAAGYTVVGIDSAPSMLALARRRLHEEGVEHLVRLVEADFRHFELDERFGLAWCGFNGFLHLIETRDQLAALQCWRRHLRPGGLLVIDVENPQLAHLAAADGALSFAGSWYDEESGHLVQKFYAAEADLSAQIYVVRRFYDEHTPQGIRRTTISFSTRILFRRELELLLQHAGFQQVTFYGDYDLSPWEPDSARMLAVAGAG